MSRELMLPSPQLSRRTSLSSSSDTDSTLPPRTRKKPRFGEVAGGAAAECAAVCCCCPFTLMNLLILAVYKVPAGVCRKAWAMKKERQRLKNKKKQGVLLVQKPIGLNGPIGLTREELEMEVKRVKEGAKEEEKINSGGDGDTSDDDEESKKVDLLETEMWSQFNGTGFFRSQSQRE